MALSICRTIAGGSPGGDILKESLEGIVKKYPKLATEVRGSGLLRGLQLSIDPSHILERAHKRGVLIITCGKNTLRFVPPLNIPLDTLAESLVILQDIFAEIDAEMQGSEAEKQ